MILEILEYPDPRLRTIAKPVEEVTDADRKLIERAKGILMKAKNLTEEHAYALLRKTAMNENKKIVEVAQAVITAAELFK